MKRWCLRHNHKNLHIADLIETEESFIKVKYIGKTEFLMLTNGKIYEVMSIERKWYRIIDDSGEDYLYPPEQFEIVEEYENDKMNFDKHN